MAYMSRDQRPDGKVKLYLNDVIRASSDSWVSCTFLNASLNTLCGPASDEAPKYLHSMIRILRSNRRRKSQPAESRIFSSWLQPYSGAFDPAVIARLSTRVDMRFRPVKFWSISQIRDKKELSHKSRSIFKVSSVLRDGRREFCIIGAVSTSAGRISERQLVQW